MRRILALALTFVMLLSLISIGTYAAEPVARIIKADKTERGTYTTIASAVAALEDGDTLELLASINEGFTLNVDGRSLTIIGSTGITVGGKIQLDNSGSYSSSAIGHVVLKDFSINHSKGEHALAIWNTMVVEADNLTLSVTRKDSTCFALATSSSSKDKHVNATFKNCHFSATGNKTYVAYLRSNNYITFIDCDMNYTGDNSAAVMIDQTFGKGCVEFNGCSITSVKGIYKSTSNDAYVVFRNSNLTYTGSGSAMIYLGGNTSVDIYNTTFTNNVAGSCLNKTGDTIPNVRLFSATFVNGKQSATMQPIRFDIPKYAPKSLSVSYGTPLTWDLGQRKVDAEAEIKAITSGSTNPTIKGIETAAVTNIWEPMTYEGVAQAKSSALEELAPWTEAEAELREYTSSATDERLTALVDGYVDDIWTETNSSAIAGIVFNAKDAYDLAAKKVSAEAELREYSSSATDERILNIVSTAIADIWNQTSALVVWGKRDKAKADIDLVNYQIAAANELREMTSSANDQRITEVLSGAIDMIDGAISKGFIDDHKPIFINVLNAALARLAAENEVKAYAQGSTNEIIVTIVSSSIDEIWSSATSTAVLPTVVQKYKTQIDAYKAAVDAEGAIRAYASSATDPRILDVVSSACAEVWTKTTSSAIEQVKTKAFADIDVFNSLIAIADEIRELTSTATDKRITDFAGAAIGALNSYTSVSSEAIDSLRAIFIGEINIRFARLAAENEVKDYANGSTQQVIVAIVSSSIEEIWSSATSTAILPAVVQKYKDKIDAYKATIDAEAAIREYSSSATDERILEVVSAAIAELWTKDTSSAIEQSKLDAFAAIDLVTAKVDAEAVVKKAAGTNDFYKLYVNSVEKQLIWDKNTVEEVKAGEQTILDAIELNKTKIAAVIELKDDRDENEDEAIVAIASTAIEAIKEAADSSAVAEILSQAIADIEFEVYTNDAQAAVAAEAEGETDEEIIAIAADAVANIEDAATKAEIDALKAEAIAAIKLIKVKIAAEALIRGEIPAGTDARVVEIASNAIAEVWAMLGTDAVEEAKSAAIAAIKLGNAKVSAEADVQAEVPADASAAVKEIESAAIADIWAAETEEKVEEIKSAAIAAIRAKILAENPVTADSTVWLVVVAAVAMLGAAVVSKKVFF